MKVVLATRNQGKIVELRRILTDIDVVGLEEFPDAPDVPETELTFAGNALLKARAIAAHTGLPAVADDSGLCVDALGGMPGVFSARWSGRHGDDEANLDLLLGQLSDVAPEHRSARFVCVAAIAWPSGTEDSVEGHLIGHVIGERRGTNGFGYDPIFVPDEESRTTAELSPEEKDAISHRGKAFRALADRLRNAQ
jgi:XTP/dITP diphosphohydrolase